MTHDDELVAAANAQSPGKVSRACPTLPPRNTLIQERVRQPRENGPGRCCALPCCPSPLCTRRQLPTLLP